MGKVLIWHNDGTDVLWDASTPELELKAFLAMFRSCDESGYYFEFDNKEKSLYEKAKNGDANAAKKLIKMRSDCEYEGWSLEEVRMP